MSKWLQYILILTASSIRAARWSQLSGSEQERAYLEQRVFEKIDSIRQRSKRPALEHDSILHLSALNHAEYMAEKGKLSHTQSGKSDLKDPQRRAAYFGAQNYLVGENVMWTDYNMRITSNKGKRFDGANPEDLANAIVAIWKESPDHYKNLMDKRYTLSGIAIVFDREKKRVYACQVFAYRAD